MSEIEARNKKMANCKTCGTEIAKSAKICPNCGAKIKKKSPILIGVIVIAVIAIIAVATSGGGTEKEGKTTNISQLGATDYNDDL